MSWQELGRWSGTHAHTTPSFATTARAWRLAWEARRTGLFPKFHVDVHAAVDDAHITRLVYRPGHATTPVRLRPGVYYLRITAARVAWAVRVEDER